MLWLAHQQLKSRSPRLRCQAVQKLGRAGGEATVALLLALLAADPDIVVRVEVVEALSRLKDARVREALARALQDAAAEVRLAAVDGLRRLGDVAAIPALVPLLRGEDAALRPRAAQALRFLGWQPRAEQEQAVFLVALGELDRAAMLGQAAVAPLTEVLKTGAYPQRVLAVNRLAEIGDPAVVEVLEIALNDADTLVRAAAAHALGRLSDRRATGNLARLLKDPDANVRVAAAGALGLVGDPRALEPLLQTLRDPHWEVRAAGLEALGRLRDRRAMPALVPLLRDEDREVRERAAEALGQVSDPDAIGPLLEALLDPETSVRQTVLRALPRLDPYWQKSAVTQGQLPRIRAALSDRDHRVQVAAGDILRRLGCASAPPSGNTGTVLTRRRTAADLFTELLQDSDPVLRQAALEALGRIDPGLAMRLALPLTADADPSVRGAAQRLCGPAPVPVGPAVPRAEPRL